MTASALDSYYSKSSVFFLSYHNVSKLQSNTSNTFGHLNVSSMLINAFMVLCCLGNSSTGHVECYTFESMGLG